MRVAYGWDNYELLDVSDGERLERWGDYTIVRPDPQVIIKTPKINPLWGNADAYYYRSSLGGGHWEYRRRFKDNVTVSWCNSIYLQVVLTAFKHTGVFPEQAVNWQLYIDSITKANRPIEVLNLFGYTGGASVACLKAGAGVTHVDASKGMINQAKINCEISGVRDKPIRFITEDCVKFLQREIRRNKKYDAIIMDPPSFGRGPNGERWKFEEDIYSLTLLCKEVLSDDLLFFVINSYTTSLGPGAMKLMLSSVLKEYEEKVIGEEIGIPISNTNLVIPAGSTTYYTAN